MKTIYIIPIEPIDQRYTKQWYDNIPLLLAKRAEELDRDVNIVTIDGCRKYLQCSRAGVGRRFRDRRIGVADVFRDRGAFDALVQ